MIDVCKIVEREAGFAVSDSTSLEELGLDSLEFLELLLTLQNETGKAIPDERVALLMTVGDLAKECA